VTASNSICTLEVDFALDFITDLPLSEGFDSVLVVTDRLTKMVHFVPCNKSITAQQTADLFLRNIFKLHGLPDDIVSDRGPQFASSFWRRLLELLGTKLNLSTAFHPQSDGQTERVNQVLEQYLRCTLNHQQDNWVSLLPLAEFAFNNAQHSSTQVSPFFANFGYHPRFDATVAPPSKNPAAENRVAVMLQTQQLLVSELRKAQARHKSAADQLRKEGPAFTLGTKYGCCHGTSNRRALMQSSISGDLAHFLFRGRSIL